MSDFYGKVAGYRDGRWVGYCCYQDADLVMRWDGVIGNTIITVTLTLRAKLYAQGQNGFEMKKSTP